MNTINNKIIKTVCKHYKIEDDKLFSKFITLFYSNINKNNVISLHQQQLYWVAASIFNLMYKRPQGSTIINCFNPVTNGYVCNNTVIEIITDDKPFVIDSINEALSSLGVTVLRVNHQVINVSRDKQNVILDVLPVGAKKDFIAESIAHIEILQQDEKTNKKLLLHLQAVLTQVDIAVKDWQPMLKQVKTVVDEIENHGSHDGKKFSAFLKWLINNNFTFLTYMHYVKNKEQLEERLGIINFEANGLSDFIQNHLAIVKRNQSKQLVAIDIEKIGFKSPVHKQIYVDVITVRLMDSNNKVKDIYCFIGLFSPRLQYQSVQAIPLVKDKVQSIFDQSGIQHISYTRRILLGILENMSREELLHTNEDKLFEIALSMLKLIDEPQLRLFVDIKPSNHFVSILITIPKQDFNQLLTKKIKKILIESFAAEVDQESTQIMDMYLVSYNLILYRSDVTQPLPNYKILEKKLQQISLGWQDDLQQNLIKLYGRDEGNILVQKYGQYLPETYQNFVKPRHAAKFDMKSIKASVTLGAAVFDIYHKKHPEFIDLKIFNPGREITLSEIMPTLDNMGFLTVESRTFSIKCIKTIWIHYYRLKVPGYKLHNIESDKLRIEETLSAVWNNVINNDRFNSLIVLENIVYRHTTILRSYTAYLKQICFSYSQEYIMEVLQKHSSFAKLLIDLFLTRFDVNLKKDQRDKKSKQVLNAIETGLQNIHSSSEDKVIRKLLEVINATVRTNYFQTTSTGSYKSYLSFKLKPSLISDMPSPSPFAEIFVCSTQMEGLHLRGGKVARGGIRWSDRPEDFRTEVLGLMKAQTTKNVVIIPVGAKGGFVVNKTFAPDEKDKLLKEGQECYKTLLRGMLDLTDNLLNDKAVAPAQTVCYDETDAYLVVAADKGTATFSDIANSISAEYKYWLNDAFASGGSKGYDHKELAITARGAWISAKQHLYEHNIDINNPFTVIGIGDMSGDVFGNGMLLSDQIELLGAFNHKHIFIDPAPNPLTSFKERERLFKLPRSQWSDYDSKLISQGGGVFERSAKTIALSAQVKQMLRINDENITPEKLIQALLKTPVEMLYNGGIGTYVKSVTESNESVGDRHNDALRVNGQDLNCKVVVEGGNLGLTQKGRIEYALNGGKINTDFIDNSAGVDCSDHEVNIKIALQNACNDGALTLKMRDQLLSNMAEDVTRLVLRDNIQQNLSISMEHMQGHNLAMIHERFMQSLVNQGVLDRELESLPYTKEVVKRVEEGNGLSRPEIAVLMSYSKMSLFDNIINSKLPDDEYYLKDLIRYFPYLMRDQFRNYIVKHPLKREIITTSIINSMINRVGSVFCYLAREDTGLMECDVARAYTIARDMLDLRNLWDKIEQAANIIPASSQIAILIDLKRVVQKITLWFLRNAKQPSNVSALVEEYGKGISKLIANYKTILCCNALSNFNYRLEDYKKLQIDEKLAIHLSSIMAFSSACDIIKVAEARKSPIEKVATTYFTIESRFQFYWLRAEINKLPTNEVWQRLSVNSLKDEIYDTHMHLCLDIMSYKSRNEDPLESWMNDNKKQIERYDSFILDMKQQTITMPMLIVAAKRAQCLMMKE